MLTVTSGIDWNGKTNSAVAKLPTSWDLNVTSSEVPEASFGSTETSSSSRDSKGLTCPKCQVVESQVGRMCQYQLRPF